MSLHRAPLILVTNDDGIDAPGIAALAAELALVGEVLVAAPAEEQSAVGHGISLDRPLRLRPRGKDRYAVSGTPADAVLLALSELCTRPPDLVVSGINNGLNLGTDVFYSGTVAGAMEAAMRGIGALAVSQEPPGRDRGAAHAELADLLGHAARFTAQLVRRVLEIPLPDRTILNINAPRIRSTRFALTQLGRRVYREQVERRLDLRGRPYYWIGGPALHGVSPPGTDAHAVEQGLISVTPLGLELKADPADGYDSLSSEGFERVKVPGDGG